MTPRPKANRFLSRVGLLSVIILTFSMLSACQIMNRDDYSSKESDTYDPGNYQRLPYQQLAAEYENGAAEAWRTQITHLKGTQVTPFVSEDGETVAVALYTVPNENKSGVFSVTGYDLATGKQKWHKDFDGNDSMISAIDQIGPEACLPQAFGNHIVCNTGLIDITTGEIESLSEEAFGTFPGSFRETQQLLFNTNDLAILFHHTQDSGGTISAINPKNEVLWTKPVAILSAQGISPICRFSDKLTVCVSPEGQVQVINLKTGKAEKNLTQIKEDSDLHMFNVGLFLDPDNEEVILCTPGESSECEIYKTDSAQTDSETYSLEMTRRGSFTYDPIRVEVLRYPATKQIPEIGATKTVKLGNTKNVLLAGKDQDKQEIRARNTNVGQYLWLINHTGYNQWRASGGYLFLATANGSAEELNSPDEEGEYIDSITTTFVFIPPISKHYQPGETTFGGGKNGTRVLLSGSFTGSGDGDLIGGAAKGVVKAGKNANRSNGKGKYQKYSSSSGTRVGENYLENSGAKIPELPIRSVALANIDGVSDSQIRLTQQFFEDLAAGNLDKIRRYCWTMPPEVMENRYFNDRLRGAILQAGAAGGRVVDGGAEWQGKYVSVMFSQPELDSNYPCPAIRVGGKIDALSPADAIHMSKRVVGQIDGKTIARDDDGRYETICGTSSLDQVRRATQGQLESNVRNLAAGGGVSIKPLKQQNDDVLYRAKSGSATITLRQHLKTSTYCIEP